MDIDRQDDVDFAYQIVESDDILGMVYYAMDNHDEMSSKRKEATEHYLYKVDGNASSRLIDAIEAYYMKLEYIAQTGLELCHRAHLCPINQSI